MPLLRWFAALTFAALLAGISDAAFSSRFPDATPDIAKTAERARIHMHFASVLHELETRDIADLSSERRARHRADRHASRLRRTWAVPQQL